MRKMRLKVVVPIAQQIAGTRESTPSGLRLGKARSSGARSGAKQLERRLATHLRHLL